MPLTSFYPNTLPNNDSSSAWYSITTRIYTYSGDVTINNVLHHLYVADFANSEIRVNTATDAWEDHGSDHPFSAPVVNGANIELYHNTSIIYRFTKPTVASWIAAGSGASTLSTTDLSGSLSLYVNNLEQRFIVYTIDATSPTTSTANGLYDVRYTLKNGNTGRVFQPSSINHTNGTITSSNFAIGFGLSLSADGSPDGLYELIHEGSSLNSFPVTVLAQITLGSGRKVHSNFW